MINKGKGTKGSMERETEECLSLVAFGFRLSKDLSEEAKEKSYLWAVRGDEIIDGLGLESPITS